MKTSIAWSSHLKPAQRNRYPFSFQFPHPFGRQNEISVDIEWQQRYRLTRFRIFPKRLFSFFRKCNHKLVGPQRVRIFSFLMLRVVLNIPKQRMTWWQHTFAGKRLSVSLVFWLKCITMRVIYVELATFLSHFEIVVCNRKKIQVTIVNS